MKSQLRSLCGLFSVWFAPEWCRIRIVGQSGVAWRGGGGVARIFEIYASK